jgi:osmotically-inducible protein OsmY
VQCPDDDVREAVKDALLYDPRVYGFNLDVTVTNEIVTKDLQSRSQAGRD